MTQYLSVPQRKDSKIAADFGHNLMRMTTFCAEGEQNNSEEKKCIFEQCDGGHNHVNENQDKIEFLTEQVLAGSYFDEEGKEQVGQMYWTNLV